MAQVLFFGGSSIQGVGDAEGGWVDRFKREVHSKMYGDKDPEVNEVFNLGVAGNAAAQVFERIQYELPARSRMSDPFVVVLSVGTNDSKGVDAPTNYVSNLEEYRATLENILLFLRSYTPNIMLVGLTPIDDTLTRPTPDGSYFSQARVREFDKDMTELAKDKNLQKVELFDSMLSLDWRAMLYDDGIHLNNMGHEWIYQRVRQPLFSMMAMAK